MIEKIVILSICLIQVDQMQPAGSIESAVVGKCSFVGQLPVRYKQRWMNQVEKGSFDFVEIDFQRARTEKIYLWDCCWDRFLLKVTE